MPKVTYLLHNIFLRTASRNITLGSLTNIVHSRGLNSKIPTKAIASPEKVKNKLTVSRTGVYSATLSYKKS